MSNRNPIEDEEFDGCDVGVLSDNELQHIVNQAVQKAVNEQLQPLFKAFEAVSKSVGVDWSAPSPVVDPGVQARPLVKSAPDGMHDLVRRGIEVRQQLLMKNVRHTIAGLTEASDALNYGRATPEMAADLQKAVDEAEVILNRHNARK